VIIIITVSAPDESSCAYIWTQAACAFNANFVRIHAMEQSLSVLSDCSQDQTKAGAFSGLGLLLRVLLEVPLQIDHGFDYNVVT